MEPRRYLRCLGQPALFAPTGEPIRFRTRKHLALLIYLAVEPRRVHTRERLAELLWPAGSRGEARHSLATALSILRPRVGPGTLETDRERVSLFPNRIEIDLDRLTAGDIVGSDVTLPLEVAAFLDGFDIPDSNEFALWKDRQQARLLPAIKDALVVLIDRCRRTGDSRQIEQLADRMLTLDELSEEAVRAKMEARAFAGDRVTALRVFEEWKRHVVTELGVHPSDILEDMAVRLRRRGWERNAPTEGPSVPTDQWRGQSFIGRATEFRFLYETWEQVRSRTATHVWILGDSGVGKSTLVRRFLTAAGLEGAATIRVQCHDLERDIPFALIGNLVSGLIKCPGASATAPETLAELARTVPEVRRRFPAIPTAAEIHGEAARMQLTEAFLQLILAVAEEHPVVLAVDDVHLADEASLAALHLILRRTDKEQLMAVFTALPNGLVASSHATKLYNAQSLLVRDIELRPLHESESRELLASLLSSSVAKPSHSVSRALIHGAGGFPMAMELLLQDWKLYGNDSVVLALGAMTSGFREAYGPTTTYERLLARIIGVLEPRDHHVLNLASVLGHRLNDLSMYSVVDLTTAQAVAGLSRLADLRVMREGTYGLEFVNELVRAHAYASIPASIRKSLHDSIATRLLRPSGIQDRPSGLEVAWHCIRAGRSSEALLHLLDGAREAASIGAPYEAERALATALPSLQGSLKVEASLLLAEVLQEQGYWQESLDCLDALDTDPGEYRDEIIVLAAEARLYISTSSAEAIYDRLDELIAIVKNSPKERTRVRAAKALALLLERHRDEKLSALLLRYVDDITSRSLGFEALGELGLTKALLMYQARQTDQSLEEANRTIKELKDHKAANLLMVHLHSGLGALSSRSGRYSDAVQHFGHALELAERLGNDTSISHLVANLALCLARLGRYTEQAELTSKLRKAKGPELTSFSEVSLCYALALGFAMRDHPQNAIDCVEHCQARMIGRIPDWIKQAWSLWKADILLLCGRRSDAIKAASETIGGKEPRLYSQAFAGPFCQWLSLSASPDNAQAALVLIEGFITSLEEYDAIDQVQILCAKYRLENHKTETSALAGLAERLERLPRAVHSQLAAFGVLPAGLNAPGAPYPR